MSKLNVVFPKTDVVACVFSYKNSNSTSRTKFDEYDKVVGSDKLDLKEYHYRVPDCLNGTLNPGDSVVVHCTTGYQVVEVKRVNAIAPVDSDMLSPVVCKCDLASYFYEVENKKRLAIMRKQIEESKKQLEQESIYELLAEKHPEFKAMLDSFKELGGKL